MGRDANETVLMESIHSPPSPSGEAEKHLHGWRWMVQEFLKGSVLVTHHGDAADS